ncbi:MAG: InlB B-repeat-containing protein, partial [Eubacteriales bacterium]|nr:InlB B-repeat-containing protein [Eubacteriales bacterium]
SIAFNMDGNTFTGFGSGIWLYGSFTEAVLHSNCFNENTIEAIWSNSEAVVDAQYNYWGHESGPKHEARNPDGEGNPVSDNVEFDPWYIDEDCTTTSDGTEPLAMGLMQVMLETFTLTFDGNGGTPELIEVQVEAEATLEALPAISREGYTFIEWNTSEDGSGEAFGLETEITEDMTFYAIWEEAEAEEPGLDEPVDEPEDGETPPEPEEPVEEIEDDSEVGDGSGEPVDETGDDDTDGDEDGIELEEPADEPEEDDDDDDYEETAPDAIVDEDDEEAEGESEADEGSEGENEGEDEVA